MLAIRDVVTGVGHQAGQLSLRDIMRSLFTAPVCQGALQRDEAGIQIPVLALPLIDRSRANDTSLGIST